MVGRRKSGVGVWFLARMNDDGFLEMWIIFTEEELKRERTVS